MSKDTPEVGDVWQTNSKKTGLQNIVVTGIKNNVYVLTDKGVASTRWLSDFRRKEYTYLGKSKASIEQLFEVENEE
jgi:hypothetical protein